MNPEKKRSRLDKDGDFRGRILKDCPRTVWTHVCTPTGLVITAFWLLEILNSRIACQDLTGCPSIRFWFT